MSGPGAVSGRGARRRHHARRPRWRRIAILAALVVGALAIGLGARAWTTYLPALDDARAARVELERLVERARTAGLGLDRDDLEAMRSDLEAATRRMEGLAQLLASDPVVAAARALPVTAGTTRGTDDVMAAGVDLLAAGDAALELAERFVAIKEAQQAGGDGGRSLAQLVELMATGRPAVDRLLAAVDRAEARIALAPADLPGPLGEVRDLIAGRLAEYGPALRGYASADDVLPGILGWDRPRRYLVLTQNPAELRPTGGYIGSYGIVAFDRGVVTERTFQDVFLLDLPWDDPFVTAPDALRRYLLGPDQPWQLADANWSPDFPTSARQARALYANEGGEGPIDGVLAVTTHTIDELLAVTGPVAVPGYGVTVASGETTIKVLQQTRVARDPETNRKAFLAAFADRLVGTLLAQPPARWLDLAARADDLRDRRLLLAWFADPVAQAQVEALRFDGAVRTDPGDYVYPVDANVAPASKLNAVTDRALDLEVRLDGYGNARNELAVTWTNAIATDAGRPIRELPAAAGGSTMGMYFRLLVPQRSRVERVVAGTTDAIAAPADLAEEAGRAVIANYFRIPPGTAHLRYAWTSPYAAELGEDGITTYRLTIQKQPGLRAEALRLRVELPRGATLLEAPDGVTANGGALGADLTFDRDLVLVLRYRTLPETGA